MKRKLIFGGVGLALLGVILLVIDLAWPALGLLVIVSVKSAFTHIEPNRPVIWSHDLTIHPATAGRPNIVVIVADDLGFNDITLNGGGVAGGLVKTANIDRIAREGVNLTAGYAGDATCAPSRAAIMTGRYATHFGFEFTPVPLALNRVLRTESFDGAPAIYHADLEDGLPGVEKMGLPAHEMTIAELLRARGYHTLMLGKWHLGEADQMHPDKRGFDEALSFMPGGSLYLPRNDANVVNARISSDPADQFLWAALPFAVSYNSSPLFAPSEYMTDYLSKEAVRAIDANKNRPFFMYLAFNAPHTPLQALKSDFDALPQIKDHRLRVYAAMVRALDRGVGRVLEALKERGLEDNTIVIFTSDNGGAGWVGLPGLNRPYRGWKMTFFEGGIHVPFFIRWPAVLPKAASYGLPVAHVDIFTTLAAAAGASLPHDRVMDGVNLLPYLEGSRVGEPHHSLFWRSGTYRALIDGDWKLQVAEHPRRAWLFNLHADPTEHHDLSNANPAELSRLLAELRRVDAQQAKPLWPSVIEAPVAIDHPMGRALSRSDEVVYWAN